MHAMKSRCHIAMVVSFVLFLFLFSAAFLILPDHAFSETENRGLQSLPHADAEHLLSGEYSARINDYFADQFPLRDGLVAIKARLELWTGKGENNGILMGRNGQLAKRLFTLARADGETVEESDLFDPAHIAGAAEGISRAAKRANVPFSVLLTGRTLDVAASAFSYPCALSDALARELRQSIDPSVTYLDMLPEYRARYESGEYVYYRTDHHWTTLGAYYAYKEVMRSYGLEDEILPESAFTRTVATDRFLGTFAAASGFDATPDTLEIWYRGNEDAFAVTADGKELPGGFYSTSYLTGRDCYSVFLDGTHDVVTVQKRGEERPLLLLAKDSFANALAPFLAQHFDLVLLNLSSPRNDFTNLSAAAEQWNADAVLVLYTLGNVINTDRMNRLQ